MRLPLPPPLTGITVIGVEHAVAAPLATRQLADLGARVIKVERPGEGGLARGDGTAGPGYSVWLDRGKQSVTLDLADAAGRRVLADLLGMADVLVHNLHPGVAERLGLDARSVTERYPRLIPCTICGCDGDGALADRPAHDLLVRAATRLSPTGCAERPARVDRSVADIAAGMYAYSGVLTALYQRATSGWISAVDVSSSDALAEWMGAPAYDTAFARLADPDGPTARKPLEQAGVGHARLDGTGELLPRPGLAGRDRWRTVATPHGDVAALLPPTNLTHLTPPMRPVPAAGQHTDEILRELGRTDAEIAALRAAGVV